MADHALDDEARQAAALSDLIDLLNAGAEEAAESTLDRADRGGDLRRLMTIARLLTVQPDLAVIKRTSARRSPLRSVLEVIGLDHVALPVRDLERAVAFYSGVLGLPIVNESRTPPPPVTPHIGFAGGEAQLLVYQALASDELAPHKALDGAMQFPHVALRLTGAAPVLARLRASGHPFDGPVSSSAGEAAIRLSDPDGNQIALIVPWPEATAR